ncbi:MAG: c-type cytochrome [Rhodobacteraceae bacterium]|nr:c-type cytochrome [Paracoccaceae bacterium]
MTWFVKGATGLILLAFIAACTSDISMPGPREGEGVFLDNCAACHGVRGEGGELIGGQTAPDLTLIAARSDGELPVAEVLSKIDGYGQGHSTDQVMPEFGALFAGETVPVDVDGTLTPTPRPLAALLAYLESVQRPLEG